jgi:hypothetical protein
VVAAATRRTTHAARSHTHTRTPHTMTCVGKSTHTHTRTHAHRRSTHQSRRSHRLARVVRHGGAQQTQRARSAIAHLVVCVRACVRASLSNAPHHPRHIPASSTQRPNSMNTGCRSAGTFSPKRASAVMAAARTGMRDRVSVAIAHSVTPQHSVAFITDHAPCHTEITHNVARQSPSHTHAPGADSSETRL